MLKGDKAIVSKSFEVPEGFKSTYINDEQIRIKGLGIQAIKQASNKNRDEVIRAVANRDWKRVVTLVPREDAAPIDYKIESKVAVKIERNKNNRE
jgi:flavin-binding protein dodecin